MVDENNEQIGKTTMWAAGSSSVLLVCAPVSGADTDADRNKAEFEYRRFEFFLDSVNQHWTPIEKKHFTDASGQRFLAFAIQQTGGGHFPSAYTTPDTVYNLLHNFERIYKPEGLHYDLIQTRSCPRAVTAGNTIAFRQVGERLCLAYGQGGIGMTTMLPNGELALRVANVHRPVDIYGNVDVLSGLDMSALVEGSPVFYPRGASSNY
jgi:hypothetical protein